MLRQLLAAGSAAETGLLDVALEAGGTFESLWPVGPVSAKLALGLEPSASRS